MAAGPPPPLFEHSPVPLLEWLQLVLDRMPIACILNDTEFRITYFNPAAERIFGYPAKEVIGQHPFGRITPVSAQPLVTELFRRLAQGDMSANAIAENSTRDGRTIVCEWINTPLHAPDGTFLGIMSMAQDITARRLAEEALRSSEERFRTVVDSLEDTVYTMDRELVCTSVFGRRWQREGRPSQLVVGKPLSELWPRATAATHESAHRRALAGENVIYEWSDESTPPVRHYHTQLSPLSDGQGQVTGVVAVNRDISDVKKVQAQLLVTDRMASVGMLAAGVAHEINNPLAAVMANLDLMARESARLAPLLGAGEFDELDDELHDARAGSQRMREIVRDLKVFSDTRDDDVRRPVELNGVVEAVTRMAANEIRHRARLIKELGRIPLVLANESRLSQVVLNLVLNAVQAIPEGHGDEHEIGLSTGVDAHGRVVMLVRDSGSGMSREVRSRLFTPFFTTKPMGVGTGLGLSICHRIVTALGGEIEVDSELGRGSVFRVILPAASQAELLAPVVEARPLDTPAERRARVLIIDDEPLIGTVVKRSLPDHEVVYCASAAAALARLEAGELYDVILCDLMMPQMTGMDLHEHLLRTTPALVERMIFLTGGAFTAHARDFLDDTRCTCLDKPFEPQDLRALVNELVRTNGR